MTPQTWSCTVRLLLCAEELDKSASRQAMVTVGELYCELKTSIMAAQDKGADALLKSEGLSKLMCQAKKLILGAGEFGGEMAEKEREKFNAWVVEVQEKGSAYKEKIEAVRTKCKDAVLAQLRLVEGRLKPICRGEPDGGSWKEQLPHEAQWGLVVKSAKTLLTDESFASELSAAFKKCLEVLHLSVTNNSQYGALLESIQKSSD